MLIPTRARARIGAGWSWPVGAEALSAALAGAPQEGQLGLWFRAPPPGAPDAAPVFVLSANFRRSPPSVFVPGRLAPPAAWTLFVGAVPRRLRHRVRALLLDEALAGRVLPWLVETGPLDGREGAAGIQLRYDAAADALTGRRWSDLLPARARR